MPTSIHIHRQNKLGEREIAGLCDVLVDCVEGGASVSFMAPMTREKAEAFWRKVAASAARGERDGWGFTQPPQSIRHFPVPATAGSPESSRGISKNKS